MSLQRYLAVALLAAAFAALPASAAPITGLYTTGVDNAGNVLGGGVADPHYSVLETSTSAITMTPIPGTWVSNNASSRWVWETASGFPINVTRTFRTTFDLTGLNPFTAAISGTWSVDNSGIDIFINGVSTGNTAAGFLAFTPFAVNTGFVAGLNTLDFVVEDVGSISGFRVGSISGTADLAAVPEPSSILLLAGGLGGLAVFRKRRTM